MTQFFVIAAALMFSLSSLACGISPLFNHETASATKTMAPADRLPTHTAEGTCTLDFPKSGLCASVTWETALSSEVENLATLRFWDKKTGTEAGPFRDVDDEAAISLWMPSMGHPSSPVTVTPKGNGVYSISRVFFIMPGAWDIRVQIKKNHQLFEQAVFSVEL